MLKLKIRTRSGEYHAELDDSDLSTAVWFSAKPFTTQVNELGCSLFFEMPLDVAEEGLAQRGFGEVPLLGPLRRRADTLASPAREQVERLERGEPIESIALDYGTLEGGRDA